MGESSATRATSALPPHAKGFGLGQAFYADPLVFARELEAVFARAWMFAGHACEIPKAGVQHGRTSDAGDDPFTVSTAHGACRTTPST